jgi:hypothetical protein
LIITVIFLQEHFFAIKPSRFGGFLYTGTYLFDLPAYFFVQFIEFISGIKAGTAPEYPDIHYKNCWHGILILSAVTGIPLSTHLLQELINWF